MGLIVLDVIGQKRDQYVVAQLRLGLCMEYNYKGIKQRYRQEEEEKEEVKMERNAHTTIIISRRTKPHKCAIWRKGRFFSFDASSSHGLTHRG